SVYYATLSHFYLYSCGCSFYFRYLSFLLILFFLIILLPPTSTLFPYTTLFRSKLQRVSHHYFSNKGVTKALENISFSKKEGEFEIGKHTSELQSRFDLVCRLLLEKKKE